MNDSTFISDETVNLVLSILIRISHFQNIQETFDENKTLPIRNVLSFAVDDLIILDELNEAVILHNLRQRYANDIIYVCYFSFFFQ
jgi:myosin heavy subunit